MSRRFHHITISVFLKEEETFEFLNTLLPLSTQTFLEQQFKHDPDHERTKVYAIPKQQCKLSLQEAEGFEGGLTVAKFTFSKISHTNKLFDTIYAGLAKEDQTYLKENALKLTDANGKFSFKISKEFPPFKLAQKNVVQCSFILAAYPKNEVTITRCVEALF